MAAPDYMVIDFAPTGEVIAMHRDQFPLGFLGPQKIERATDIRFDDEKQSWELWLNINGEFAPPLCPQATGFETYEQARKCEVAWLEECRLAGLNTNHRQSYAILERIRAASN